MHKKVPLLVNYSYQQSLNTSCQASSAVHGADRHGFEAVVDCKVAGCTRDKDKPLGERNSDYFEDKMIENNRSDSMN